MPSNIQQYQKSVWIKQNTPYATNTGIVIHHNQACLIDPGISPADCESINQFLLKQNADVKFILLTHAHWDHLLGVHYFPQAQVVTHQKYLDVIRRHQEHLVQQVSAWWESVNRVPIFDWTPPFPMISFAKHSVISLGGLTLSLFHAPGHTSDHIVIYIPYAKVLWAGDMLSDREIPLVEDIVFYQKTLVDMKAFKACIVVPGHGRPATETVEIQQRFEQDMAYVDNIRACVQYVLDCGYGYAQTVKACIAEPFSQKDEYPNAHRWNIENAYLRLGGISGKMIGWVNEWQSFTI
jgi:glyoxylase-like metal-dependent hydrolase (beta-lactamase superfamily II)